MILLGERDRYRTSSSDCGAEPIRTTGIADYGVHEIEGQIVTPPLTVARVVTGSGTIQAQDQIEAVGAQFPLEDLVRAVRTPRQSMSRWESRMPWLSVIREAEKLHCANVLRGQSA